MASNQSTAYSCGIELEMFIKPRTTFIQELEDTYDYDDAHHPADDFFKASYRWRGTNRRALHGFLKAALITQGLDAVLQPDKDYSKWHIEDDESIAEGSHDPELSRFCMPRLPALWTNADQLLP